MKLLSLLILIIAGLIQLQTQDADPIAPAEAVKTIGKPTAYIEMKVQAAKNRLEKPGLIYLDSEGNFEHANNLGVALSAGVVEQSKIMGIEKPEDYFLGKKI